MLIISVNGLIMDAFIEEGMINGVLVIIVIEIGNGVPPPGFHRNGHWSPASASNSKNLSAVGVCWCMLLRMLVGARR